MSKPVVTVKQGELRGLEVENVIGGSYISFKGIPYAAPPVGDLRFRDPQPSQPWTGVRGASKEGSKCAQFDIFTRKIEGDDDCLYLNVATTSLTGSRPVMVWIHGGGFTFGDGGSDLYGADYIMGSDVVLVSMNYRLGVLGFLHLDHEAAPGNVGLKDQVAALKWVKENIAQFGGNPNNVTIFGESAGGASVNYLLLSPLTKGLFHKAIMQSGVVFNPFAFSPAPVDNAHRYVAALGRDITDPKEIVEYLRTVPVQRLIEVQQNFLTLEEQSLLILPFVPGVDDKSAEPFLPESPQTLAAEGFDIPVIIGYNSHEGIFFASDSYWSKQIHEVAFTNLSENFEKTLPADFFAKAPSEVSEIARELKKFYFGDKQITNDLVDEYIRYYGELHLQFGVHRAVEIQRKKKSPTYFYRFSFDSPNSAAKFLLKVEAKGAAHLEEIFYLFSANLTHEHIENNFGKTEQVVRDRIVRMWTDFAKTGNPTPSIDDLITEKWEPVTETTKNYLDIDAELSAGVNPDEEVFQTWNGAFPIADHH